MGRPEDVGSEGCGGPSARMSHRAERATLTRTFTSRSRVGASGVSAGAPSRHVGPDGGKGTRPTAVSRAQEAQMGLGGPATQTQIKDPARVPQEP